MRTFRQLVRMSSLFAFLLALTALSAFADPPGRAVRLKYISGPVSIQPGGVNDWVAAVVNRPLTTSDRVWTDKEARAELHMGSAALRLNAETSMTLTNVSDDIVQIELDQGTLNLHIRHLFGGETYEIDTPNQAFTILKAGDYRFDVDPSADTTSITVWHGEGEANGQGPGVKLKSGHQASFTNGTSLEHQEASAPGLDGFDDWCRVRDDRVDHAKSYEYVSADVVGADELDDYGTWRTVPTYGAVWVPAVAPGWAPYHYGHWVWVEPWGWTWVDDAPWGFAPCHYGRWVYAGGFWAWAPGPVVVARPVYAPALVAWVGGPHFGISLSFGGGGGVGWFPLGWGEPYVPSYHVSQTYFQQVNVTNTHITNITQVTNNYYINNNNTTVVNNNIQNIHYANQNVAGAVTAVPTRAMTSSEPVAKAAVAVPASEMKNVSVANTAAVAPEKTSLLGAKANSPAVVPPARAMASRPVVSHIAPPAKPIPFEARQEALAKNPGRPLDAQTETQLRTNLARQPQAPMAQNPAPPSQSGKPASPAASSTPGAGNTPTPRPVPRPGGLPSPLANSSPATPGKNAASEVAQPTTPVRNIPRPPQVGGPPFNSANPTAGTPNPSAAAAPRPAPRPPQPSPVATGNTPVPAAHPVSNPTPVRPAVDSVKPSMPRAPQNTSMPRGDGAAPKPAPQPRPAQPRQVESTPRPPREAHQEHAPAPKPQQPKHEEKPEHHESH